MSDNQKIQKNFYDKVFEKRHVWEDVDFPESSRYAHNRFLNSTIPGDAKNILEIGCGNGLLTFFLLKRPLNLTAVDISEKAIENMRGQFGAEMASGKLKLVTANLIDFLESSEEKFDAIVGSGIIHHIEKEEWERFFRAVSKNLKSGGIFACAPEPNAGGAYRLAWRLAKCVYKLFGIEYDWEVERGTLDIVPNNLVSSLKNAGFSKAEILPFQSIPHFHLKVLAFFDRLILDKIKGRFAMYIIVKAQK